MNFPQYRAYIDFNRDGDFSDAYEDITQYVRSVNWDYGKSGISGIAFSCQSGSCEVVVENWDCIFSTLNATSPLITTYGSIAPGLPIRLTMDGTVMFTMYLDSLQPQSGVTQSEFFTTLIGHGPLTELARRNVTIEWTETIYSGAAVSLILTAAGWPIGKRTIDTGCTVFSCFWTDDNYNALQALIDIAEAEGGLIGEDRLGGIWFQDRGYRYRNQSPTYTFGNKTLGLNYKTIQQADAWKNIITKATCDVHIYNLSEEKQLYKLLDIYDESDVGSVPPSIAAGQTLVLTGKYSGSVAVADWSMVTWSANSSALGTGTDLSQAGTVTLVVDESATRITFTFTNSSGGTAYIIRLMADGYELTDNNVTLIEKTSNNYETYGEIAFNSSAKYITSVADGQAYCAYFLALYEEPRPAVNFTIDTVSGVAHQTAIKAIDISNPIVLNADADTGLALPLNSVYYIENVKHNLMFGQSHKHEVTYGCVLVPPIDPGLWSGGNLPRPVITSDESSGVPDDLETFGFGDGLLLQMTGLAWKYNATIDKAQIRYKLYISADAPTTESVDLSGYLDGDVDGTDANGISQYTIGANKDGAGMEVIASEQGVAFYAIRFHNSAGWSVWSDGNTNPVNVKSKVSTTDPVTAESIGPPTDWVIKVKAGPVTGTVIVESTRPKNNANLIWFWHVQIKDITKGPWRELDENAGASVVYYDGSATAHTIPIEGDRVTRDSGTGFGTASQLALCMIDQRYNSVFDIAYTGEQWARLFEGQTAQTPKTDEAPATATYFLLKDYKRNPVARNGTVRIKFVKAPWAWDSEGYLYGQVPGDGWSDQSFWTNQNSDGSIGDKSTQTFVSEAIPIGSVPLKDIRARCWFHTSAFCSWGGISSGAPEGNFNQDEDDTGDDEVTPDATVDKMIRITIDQDIILNNIENAQDLQTVRLCIVNAASEEVTVTFGDKYRNGLAFPTYDDGFGNKGLSIVIEELS